MQNALPTVSTTPRTIAVALIDRCPLNPRIVSDAEADEMGESLKNDGQAVKIWLRPSPEAPGRYELVDGERRWRGALAKGIETLEALVGDWSTAQILRIIWITGTKGRTLSVLEQARWARTALQQPGATLVTVGAEVGVTRELLSMRLSLLELPAFAQEKVQSGELPWTTAYALAMVPGEAARAAACHAAITPPDVEGPLSYRDTVEMIRRDFARPLKGAPWKLDDPFPSVEGAGPCSGCRYRVGNNPEEYGQMKVKGVDFCMHPECFAKKEAAVRQKVAAKEAGKTPLTSDENARVFRPGHEEPDPASGYALAHRPLPPDLVKDEVSANRAPTFAEVSPAAPLYVATDGTGRCVDLVKVAEAIAGTVEPAIFRREVVHRYGIADNAKAGAHEGADGERVVTPSLAAATPKGEPTAGSLAAEQKRQKAAEKAADRSKAKKLRACAEWMLELHGALTAQVKPEGYAYTLASLRWEHVLLSVADEDALLVLRALTEEEPVKGQSAKSCLAEFVAGIGGAEELQAVVDLLMIAPALRAQGTEAKWVAEWHRHLVLPIAERVPEIAAPAPAAPFVDGEPVEWSEGAAAGYHGKWFSKELAEAATGESTGHVGHDQSCVVREMDGARLLCIIPTGKLRPLVKVPAAASASSNAEKEKLTAIAKAHAAGMPVEEIARSFELPLAEVCGMLEVPVPAGLLDEARRRVEELFERCGTRPKARDAMAKMACKCPMEEIRTLDQWVALAAQLTRIAEAKEAKQRKASSVDREETE